MVGNPAVRTAPTENPRVVEPTLTYPYIGIGVRAVKLVSQSTSPYPWHVHRHPRRAVEPTIPHRRVIEDNSVCRAGPNLGITKVVVVDDNTSAGIVLT